MKIANIGREILQNFWTTTGIWMKFLGKMCLMIILKVTKKPGFHPFFRRCIFRKTTGEGVKLTLPPSPNAAVLGLICLFKLPYITLSRVITETMLFLQFVLYSSSFVGTLKNEILVSALELCQFSPGILKFNTKHEDNLFTLNCSTVPCTFLFTFHAGLRGLGSKNFRNSSYKEKTAGSARVSTLSFRFLWLWLLVIYMFNHDSSKSTLFMLNTAFGVLLSTVFAK